MSVILGPIGLLLLSSLAILAALVAMVVARKLRRDAAEAAARGRRERFQRTLHDGDAAELAALAREVGSGLAAQRDLGLACVAVDPLPAPRLSRVHEGLGALVQTLTQRLSARDPVVRGQAMVLCARLRLPGCDALVAPFLSDRDGDVRLAACGSLAWLATSRAAQALIDALAYGGLAPERLVERLGQPWAADTVITQLQLALSDDGPAVPREWLARALGLAGVTRAEPVLLELLRIGDTEERISAAPALGSCGTSKAVAPLTGALRDPEWTLRGQAAKALGKIGDQSVVPALAALLSDRAWWVRAGAAGALRTLGAPGHAALVRAAADHADPFARDRAREALALEAVVRARAVAA